MYSENEAMAAFMSAVVWLAMTEARQGEFLRAVKENYHLDVASGTEALAILFAESQDSNVTIGKARRRFMDSVWHFDVDNEIAMKCIGFRQIGTDLFWVLLETVAITFAVHDAMRDGAAQYNAKRLFVEAVVAAYSLIDREDRAEEIGQLVDVALQAMRQTDAPPAPNDGTVANDSQGAISPDMPILTFRDVQQLVLLLRQAQVEALHEERLRDRDKTTEVESGSTDIHRIDRLDREAAHAKGRAEALHRAIESIIDTSPALLGWYDGMRCAEQAIEPHPARVRSEPLPGQRPREFAWGTPSIMGFIPAVPSDADAAEIHFVIPEAAGIHPLFRSAGEELADRLRAIVEKLVNSTPDATVGLVRLELRDQRTRNDGTWRGANRWNCTWAGPVPLTSETTTARNDQIPCPWCGDAQPVPSRVDVPALFAGDVHNTHCQTCGAFYQLRYEAAYRLYARPVPK